jgi:hypothetical protein
MNQLSKPLSTLVRLVLCLTILAALAPQAQSYASAASALGDIAYVRTTPNGDQIRLIEPDGLGDHLLWQTGVPEPAGITDIQQLAWKPDASELAFTSSHETNCSRFESDIYALRADGVDYRRVSGPPACGSRAGIPTGTVIVPVENKTFEGGKFSIYFEGAPGSVDVLLSPGDEETITFTNVADYGNRVQYAVAVYGEVRMLFPGANADVIPGQTIQTGQLEIRTGLEHYGFQWPTYRTDGSFIDAIFNKDELHQIGSANRDLGIIPGRLAFLPISSDFLAWGPTPARADQFLYEAWKRSADWSHSSPRIFLGDLNGSTEQELIDIDPTQIGRTVLGLAWLPDGSGFLYSYNELTSNWIDKADVFEYSFATRQSRRVTDLSGGFIRRMSVSPDGQQIVYEYQTRGYWTDENPSTDLWVMNRDGSGRTLLVQNGRAPAWSPRPIPAFYTLNQVSPASAMAGGPSFTLQLTGAGFDQGAVVRWNDVDLATVYVSGTRLDATVPAALIARAGTASLTVYNATSGVFSNALTFNILNPVPVLTTLTPSQVTAGSAGFTLQVTGSNFIGASVVRWNGADLSTTYVNAGALSAAVPADRISAAGSANITVFNPAPGGGVSNSLTFTINSPTNNNPVPVLTALTPSQVTAGSAGFTLQVTGSSFIRSSVVRWNGADLSTTYVNAGALSAAVPADRISAAGSASITVFNPAPGGGVSNSLTFTINSPTNNNPVPVLTALTPSQVTAGSAGFTLQVTGSSFIRSSVVRWNGADLTTTYGNAGALSAAVPADRISAAGSASITVFNPAPGGGASNSLTFTINNPVPVVARTGPAQVAAGSVGFNLQVSGSGFIRNSLVKWNGAYLTTTFVSEDELTAAVPASKVAAVGSANITVYNPPLGGGESNPQVIQIYYPTPNITSLSPDQITPGSKAFYLTVKGSGFMNGSVVRWGERNLGTTYVNGNEVYAFVWVDLITQPCTVQVSVINPGPNGTTSGSTFFIVIDPSQQKKIYLPFLVEKGG